MPSPLLPHEGGCTMKYYKVRPEFDNKHVSADYFLVGNELYTPSELRRLEAQYNRYYRTPLNFHRMFEEVSVAYTSSLAHDILTAPEVYTPCFSR